MDVATDFIFFLRSLVQDEIKQDGAFVLCEIAGQDASNPLLYNVYVIPDRDTTVKGVLNLTRLNLSVGDMCYVYKINNDLTTSFVCYKLGAQAKDIAVPDIDIPQVNLNGVAQAPDLTLGNVTGSGSTASPAIKLSYTDAESGNSAGSSVLFDNEDFEVSNNQIALKNGGGGTSLTTTVVIEPSDWSGTTCVKDVTGVTSSSVLLISAAPTSLSAMIAAGVYCSAQGTDSLTFTCVAAPTTTLVVTIYSPAVTAGTSATAEVTIPVSGWSSLTYTATVTGMTSTAKVFLSPAVASMSEIVNNQVYCSAQGTNSLTFTAATTPSTAVTMNVYYEL